MNRDRKRARRRAEAKRTGINEISPIWSLLPKQKHTTCNNGKHAV